MAGTAAAAVTREIQVRVGHSSHTGNIDDGGDELVRALRAHTSTAAQAPLRNFTPSGRSMGSPGNSRGPPRAPGHGPQTGCNVRRALSAHMATADRPGTAGLRRAVRAEQAEARRHQPMGVRIVRTLSEPHGGRGLAKTRPAHPRTNERGHPQRPEPVGATGGLTGAQL